ncbi:MAG: lytic transglycosylase domain-containing protein [Alphaproteobacteria bacterium]
MVTLSFFSKLRKRLCFLAVLGVAGLSFGRESRASLSLVEQAIKNPKQLAHLDLSSTHQSPGFVRDFLFWLKAHYAAETLSFSQIVVFLEKHPDWPHHRQLQLAAEAQLGKGEAPAGVVAFFRKHKPISSKAHLAYLQALSGTNQVELTRGAVGEAWMKVSFSPADQQAFLASFRHLLKASHHVARLEEMLWGQEIGQAKQVLGLVSEAKQSQARVWIGFLQGDPSALKAYNALPANLRNHEGLHWAQVFWLKKQKKCDEAIRLMLANAHSVSHPLAWWQERNYLAREMLQAGDPKLAYRLITQHRVPGTSIKEYAEAEWFAGWLALRFLKQPTAAKKHFEQFQRVVKTPISLARAGYWLGRTHEALKQSDVAHKAYSRAALYKTTFYGQLAALKVNQTPFPRFAEVPQASHEARKAFEQRELVKLARALRPMGPEAEPFVRAILEALAKHAHTSSQKQLVVTLTGELMPTLAAEVDRRTLDMSGTVLRVAYPLLPLPSHVAKPSPEKALVMAVIHRETRFNPQSVGDAGERGLMQIMPQTAHMEAKALGLNHHPDKLFEPSYNIKLGMAHLTRHLSRFNNSYILGIAAYNAGDTAVSRWVETMGNPHQGKLDVVDWIESIPYGVTRDYVQRVLENLTIYRARLGQIAHTPAHVLQGKPVVRG